MLHPDVVNLEIVLCQNLAYTRWLFARALGCTTEGTRVRFVHELRDAVEARLLTVEELVHPVLSSHGWEAGPAASQHSLLRGVLRELVEASAGRRLGPAPLSNSSAIIEQQLALQARLVVAASSALLSPAERVALGTRVLQRLDHQGTCVPRNAEFRRECPARAGLVQKCPARHAS